MKYLLPIAAMVCTVGTTLLMLVFHAAGAANAGPEQIRSMKLWAGGLSILALVCVIASIVLMRNGQIAWAALIAFIPVVVMGIVFFIALL
ncbi:MAG: hypothetical protein ABI599_11380 [Flavobacteriales bacterium]